MTLRIADGARHWLALAALAVLACLPTGAAQAAEDGRASADAVRTLRFQEFFQSPVGDQGLQPSAALLAADGQQVQHDTPTRGRFFLTPRPVQMSEHADGDADDLPPATLLVLLCEDQQQWLVPHTRGLVTVTGVLHWGREESEQGRVTWVQLQLAPQATQSMNTWQWISYLHSLQHQH